MSYDSLSDEKLVEHIRSADQEQYRTLVQRYQEKLYRYANRIMNNDAEAAQDVVQQSFIKAFINLRGFDTDRKFSSWIYRIVHNEAINYLKKHKKLTQMNEHTWNNLPDMKTNDQVETISKEELRKEMQELIAEIPIKYKAPLMLYYFEDKSYEEISNILRLPRNTVGTNISRGKKLLHTLYVKRDT